MNKPYNTAHSLEDLDSLSLGEIRRRFDELRAYTIELETQNVELRESEEKHRNLFETMNQGVVYQSPDGQIISANPAAERILGLSYKEMLGKTSLDSVWNTIREDGSELPGNEHPSMVALRTGKPVERVIVGVMSSQRNVHTWISVNAIPLFEPGATKPFQVYVTFEDITDQRLAEQNYQTLFREMLNGFALHEIICDNGAPADYRFLDINPAFERITGLRRADVIGRTVLEILPDIEPHWIETYGRVALTGESIHFENSAGERHYEVTAFQSKPGQFACIFTDLTERKKAEEHLKKYKNIVSSAQDGIALLDTNHRYTIISKSYERYSGINKKELIGMKVAEYLGEDVYQLSVKPHLDRCLQGEIINYQEWFDYPVLGRRFVDVTYTPYRDMNNCIAGVVSNTRDITEQRQAQDAVARSESKYRELFELNQDAITIFRIEPDRTAGKFLDMNQAALKLGGYSKEEYRDLRPSDFEKASEETIKKRLAEIELNGHAHFETVITNKAGDQIPVEIQVRSIPFEGGMAMMNITRDIRIRKHMENSLRASHELLHNLAQQVPGVIYQYRLYPDGSSSFPYASQGMHSIYEVAPEDVRADATPVFSRLHPDDHDRVAEAIRESARTLKMYHCEFRVILPRQGLRWRLAQAQPQRMEDGSTLWHGIISDVTERKQAEEEKKILSAQLQHAQKMEAIGTLAGGIAHDFNNILGAILGYAEIVREDSPEGSMAARDLDQVLKAGNRAKALVKQILAFSRQTDTEKMPVQPAMIIREAVTLLRSSIPATISIKQNVDAACDLILADPNQIHQIIMNLCINSFHAMEEHGGTLSITLKKAIFNENDLVSEPGVQPGNFVQIVVEDTGTGIEPEIRNKIFDPYFTTKKLGKGSGMGLAITHGIVKNYGGFITCESLIGKGTTFYINLPSLKKDIPLATGADEESLLVGSERILFIDDEPMLARMSQTMLTRLGYAVTVQMSSLEALTTFRNQPDAFDLVITDQTMPEITGFDLARRMLEIRPNLPIILCTGYSSLISEEMAKSVGIKGFALKPLAKKAFSALIRAVLDEGK